MKLSLEGEGKDWRLLLNGDWSLAATAAIQEELQALPETLHGSLTCDWTHAESTGIGPVWILLTRLGTLSPDGVRHVGNPPHTLQLLQRLQADRHALCAPPPAPAPSEIEEVVGNLGRWVVLQGTEGRAVIGFLGRISTVVREIFSRPRALRGSSLARHIYETGVTAIPIVSLIAFLISVIVAYLGAQQLSRFGADIFVVDLVTIATLREMGVLLTSVIVAGRSGSAYTAELGSMKMREEIDALRTMGFDPIEVLILPRMLALIIALPILAFLGAIAALYGGGLVAWLYGGVDPEAFLLRLRDAISIDHFTVGIIKAPVMAAVIGIVACVEGLAVQGSAESLGQHTTASVVKGIFFVIVMDGVFAIFFASIGM